MIRLGRSLKENTAHAATLVSLFVLVACSGGEASDPNDPNDPPPYQGPAPATIPGEQAPGTGVDPTAAPTMTPVGVNPSNEGSPDVVPLEPDEDGDDDGDGNGNGDSNTTDPPTTDPPVTDPATTDPPVTDPPTTDPPVTDPPTTDPPVIDPPVTPPVTPPPVTPPAFVENSGANCPLPQFPPAGNLPAIGSLPDPFTKIDGTRVTTRAEWRCRRQEINELSQQYIYGDKPNRPESVTGTVTNNSITVNVQNQGRTASFSATITRPAGVNGPVPAIIGYGGSPFQNNILQEGVAFINYNVDTVGNETTRNPKQGAFYTVNPNSQFTGMLMAWAWGVSRMIDVIEASGSQLINPRAIGVTGCSRSGKGAFTAGAFDERVALTIPFESGTTGVPAWRLIVAEGGETPSQAFGYRPWAGDAFGAFLNNQTTLPVDTHEIIGMVAPRGLFVMGNPHIVNLAPRSEHVAVVAGKEIYEALGVAQNLTYVSNIQDGAHCVFRNEFVAPLQQNIRKFLKGENNATTGAVNVHQNGTGNPGPNITWQTPLLQ